MTDEETTGGRGRAAASRMLALLAKVKVLLIVVAVGLAFVAGMRVGGCGGSANGVHDHADGGDVAAPGTIWTCSMHPQIRSQEPGQCPICGMDLIPVEQGAGGAGGETPNRVVLTDRAKALARITTAEVTRVETKAVELRLLGRFEVDERRVRTVAAWTAGRIDRLHVAVTGQRIARGQVIATIYSPEIYAAQQDLIQAAHQVERLRGGSEVARGAAEAALEATQQRLRLLGVPDDELSRMAAATSPFRQVPIRSSFGGTVIERLVNEGAYINPGSGIYRVADLSQLWVQLDAYERDLAYLSRGQKVALTVSAYPGETFEGQVAFIDPVMDARTRTSKVRVEVANAGGKLQPGMFAEAEVAASQGEGGHRVLVIPETAPLFTGRRSVVYVELPDEERPTYEAREVRLGHKMGEFYPVVAGLSEGERVVINGAFTLDADLQIRGGAAMMSRPDDSEPSSLDRVVAADPAFTSSLEPLMGAYLNVQERLAADDLEAAKVAARAVTREVGSVTRPSSDEARQAWEAIAEGLRQESERAGAATDIDGARAAFEDLSSQVAALLERFGNPLATPVRLVFCPMAFNNRGAEWVQRGAEIDNSYFGAAMRRCGEIRATVEPGGHLIRGDG
jgi:Cu(I)/Ag(I) efflux system membrane fusion protein